MWQGWGGVTVYNPPGCGNLVSNNSGSYKLSSKVIAEMRNVHAISQA